jgi:hypothetical protein
MEVSEMAKKKVHPRPGALQELLKKREMTQWDAADHDVGTGVDRKTLRKIDRGEEVKLDTLQKVATKLRVPVSSFFEGTPAGDEINRPSDSMHSVMLRQLDAPRDFLKLLDDADGVDWLPNARVVDEKAKKVLKNLATAAQDFYELKFMTNSDSWVMAAEGLAKVLKELHQRRLAVLGGNYLFWMCSADEKRGDANVLRYESFQIALFSVEPSGTQTRRVQISSGEEPPTSPPPSTIVFVDDEPLVNGELDPNKRDT